MSAIVGVKRRHKLGLIDIELTHNEAELLQAAAAGQKGPHNWDLSAMAVMVAASKVNQDQQAEIDELRDMVRGLAKVAAAAGLDVKLEGLAELGRSKVEPPQDDGLDDMFDKAVSNLKASSPLKLVDEHVEPDAEELQADYERRLAKAKVLAASGAGWPHVVKFAFAPRAAPQGLCFGGRKPTPDELATIEKWLDVNATRRPGDSL